VTFSAVTTKESALSGSGKFFVGSILTPSAGSQDTIGNNDGGSGAEVGDTFVMFPTTYFETGLSWLPVGQDASGNHDSFSFAAVDGDSSTSASALKIGAGDIVVMFAGWPGFAANRWSSLKLKVRSGGTTSNNAGNSVTVDYSTDGGSTWTTIWTIGANATRAAATDVITLPTNLSAGSVIVRFTMHVATAGSSQGDMYELWQEGQQ
jgi:hypothetical protein